MPFIGAAVVATLAGWLVDSLLESWASVFVRVMAGFVVSTVAFYVSRMKLKELRGD